ncbi:hypothetical protein ACJX0J_019499, partial [Zea mays]
MLLVGPEWKIFRTGKNKFTSKQLEDYLTSLGNTLILEKCQTLDELTLLTLFRNVSIIIFNIKRENIIKHLNPRITDIVYNNQSGSVKHETILCSM